VLCQLLCRLLLQLVLVLRLGALALAQHHHALLFRKNGIALELRQRHAADRRWV